jgi:hypothetical protein
MEAHADIVRRLAGAVLACPGLIDEDRAEVQAVIDALDRIVRVLGPEAGSLEIVNLFALQERDLLARLHAVCKKYDRQAS